jgi:hypothetical protein
MAHSNQMSARRIQALPLACVVAARALVGRARLPALHRGVRQVLGLGSAPGPRFMGARRVTVDSPGSELLAGRS